MSLERTRRRVVAATARKPAVSLQGIRVFFELDQDPDASYLDQEEFEGRKDAYRHNEFQFITCRAEAEVNIEGVTQTLESGGLSGIESDSEKEYLDEIIAQEWTVLRGVLKTVGVPTSELPLEVDPSWVEWRM